MKRIDERDTILSRIRYKPGDGMYEDYYMRNPEKKEGDDALRNMPDIGSEATPMYDAIRTPFADSAFAFMADIKQFSEKKGQGQPVALDPVVMTKQIKDYARYLGATDVGIAKMKDDFYYTHHGRYPDVYGNQVDKSATYGIVMTKEMSREMINRAPHVEEMTAVTKAYMDLAIMGMWLSYYIAQLGYDAKNNMDMSYVVFTPFVAEEAGLGEIGRAGLLVTPEQGMRVRIGVVTTNLPLVADSPKNHGIKELCGMCGKCAQNCPARALDANVARELESGYFGYAVNQEKCFKMWKTLGTDCGICLASCPLSQLMPEDIRSNLIKEPEKIIAWDKEKNGKRMYNKLPLDTYL